MTHNDIIATMSEMLPLETQLNYRLHDPCTEI